MPYIPPVAPVVTPPDHAYMNMIAHSDLAGAFNRGFMAVAQANQAKQRMELEARQLVVNTGLEEQKMELAKQAQAQHYDLGSRQLAAQTDLSQQRLELAKEAQDNQFIYQSAHNEAALENAKAANMRGLAAFLKVKSSPEPVEVTLPNGQKVKMPPDKAGNYILKEAETMGVEVINTPNGPQYVRRKDIIEQEKQAKRYEAKLADGLAKRDLTIEQWGGKDPGYRYKVENGVEKRSLDGDMYASEINGQKFSMPYKEASVLMGQYRRLKEMRQPRMAVEQAAAAQAPAGAPAVGEVRMGYRFKGGDPSNPANWEKQ